MISKRVPHPPLVPAEAGTQALLHKLGSRFRGNERGRVFTKHNHTLSTP
jgi:hypothetical protein